MCTTHETRKKRLDLRTSLIPHCKSQLYTRNISFEQYTSNKPEKSAANIYNPTKQQANKAVQQKKQTHFTVYHHHLK
jgi:hypothetical protein